MPGSGPLDRLDQIRAWPYEAEGPAGETGGLPPGWRLWFLPPERRRRCQKDL